MSGTSFDSPEKIQVISVLNKLSSQSGGVTRVSLSRAKSLALSGYTSIIATVEFDNALPKSVSELLADERLGANVGVLNFFEYYGTVSHDGKVIESISEYFVNNKASVVTRHSRYIGITGFRSNEYLDHGGRVFARETVSAEGNIIGFQLDMPGKGAKNFLTRDDAYTHWLDELSEHGDCTVFIADASTKSDAVSKVSSEKARKVLTLHGNHLASPYVFGSPVKNMAAKIIDNARFCDALVLLTNAQAADIARQFPRLDNLSVIPNSVGNSGRHFPSRSGVRFAVVSRLETVKNVELIVRAFNGALSKNPNLSLDIWGHGSREPQLRKMIEGYGIGDQVHLKGYANPVSSVFLEARASLSASVSEGFGLSILESMSFGCPVISLSSNYGPVELVEDGVNGYLVNNEQAMSERILRLAEDVHGYAEMSRAGIKTADKYSPDKITAKWVDLITSLSDPTYSPKATLRSNPLIAEFSSIGGNIIVKNLGEEISAYRRLQVVRVDRSKLINDKACLIASGVYDIHSVHVAPDGRLLIKIAQGGNEYKGVIPKGSVTFRLLS